MSSLPESPDVPAMPVVLTPQAMRGLLPLRFGRGVRLELQQVSGRSQLALDDASGGRSERFAGTPAGWLEAWATAASWARPAGFRRAVELYTQRVDMRRTPVRSAEIAVRLDARLPLVLAGLVFLGGHGFGELLRPGMVVDLRKGPSALVLTGVGDGDGDGDGAELCALADTELTGAEASGPGKVTTKGFVATVGQGLVGDLIEQGAASWMTERFGRTEVQTSVRITGRDCELFFRSVRDLPEQAQIALSGVRALVSGRPATWVPDSPVPDTPVPDTPVPDTPVPASTGARDEDGGDGGDLVTKLERLARLRESGALSDVEFQAAKDRLLA